MSLVAKGAEADIFLEEGVVKKIRIPKKYRLPELDFEIRKKRTRSESRLLGKLKNIGPGFIGSDDFQEIKMAFVEGSLVKDVLDKNVSVAKEIGVKVSAIHDLDIVHGDLTTSNMILVEDGSVILIDFGLGFVSDKLEDKAVDLHLFREAIESKHFDFEKEIWDYFLEGYNPRNKEEVLKRLVVVESRGRNKLKE